LKRSSREPSRLASFGYAVNGIAEAVRTEGHMRFHLFAAAAVVACASWLRVGRDDWLWLGMAIALVIAAELMNTAVERTVDLASGGASHPLAKAAKDAAAGAVLVTAIFAAIVGLAVLGPPLRQALFG